MLAFKCVLLLKLKILIKWSVYRETFGIIGQNPSVSKSNQLHVGIFWIFFID